VGRDGGERERGTEGEGRGSTYHSDVELRFLGHCGGDRKDELQLKVKLSYWMYLRVWLN
jgi:hypothetical protein